MMAPIYASFTTEWIKSKNSFAKWLILSGALFMPAFVAFVFVSKWKHLIPKNGENQWHELTEMTWKGMAFLYSGFFIALLTCLLFNIEYKNNTWKHLFTLPISRTQLYANKLITLLLFLACFYLLFIPVWVVAGYVTSWIRPQLEMARHSPNYGEFLRLCAHSYISSLSIVALHFWLSIRFKNMIIPLAVTVIGSIVWIALFQGKAGEIVYFPYAYPYLTVNPPMFLQEAKWGVFPEHEVYSLCYFVLLSVLSYWDFLKKFKSY